MSTNKFFKMKTVFWTCETAHFDDQCSAFLRTQEPGCTNRMSSPLHTMFRGDRSNATSSKASQMAWSSSSNTTSLTFPDLEKGNWIMFWENNDLLYAISSWNALGMPASISPHRKVGKLATLWPAPSPCFVMAVSRSAPFLQGSSLHAFLRFNVDHFTNVLLFWQHRLKNSCSGLV